MKNTFLGIDTDWKQEFQKAGALTNKEQVFLNYLCFNKHKTYRTMAVELGLKSTRSVFLYIKSLIEKGYIEKEVVIKPNGIKIK